MGPDPSTLDRVSSRYDVVRQLVGRVRLKADGFGIEVNRAAIQAALGIDGTEPHDPASPIILDVRATRIRQHKDVKLIIGDADGSSVGQRNEALVALLAEARQAYDDVVAAPEATIADAARATGRCRKRLAKLVRIAMLAPDIVERCLAGTQPAALTTATLFQTDLPIAWIEQRRVLAIA